MIRKPEVVALACELLAWMEMFALHGARPRRWEPKRLRLRLFAATGRLARGGRAVKDTRGAVETRPPGATSGPPR
jgi:hypothetical protein